MRGALLLLVILAGSFTAGDVYPEYSSLRSDPAGTSTVTGRFAAVGEPLAHARGSDPSRDGNGAVAENRAKPRGQRTREVTGDDIDQFRRRMNEMKEAAA